MNISQQLVKTGLDVKMMALVTNANTVTKMRASARKKERVVPAIAMVQEHALTASNATRMVPALLCLEAVSSAAMLAWNAVAE
jgi:hypothetical protein